MRCAWTVCSLVGLLASTACLEPAAERANKDELVGHDAVTELEVDVAEGHAAIRELSAERVRLWQSAPALEFALKPEHAGTVELRIDNAMPASVLSAVDAAAGVEIEPLERQRPTVARFRVRFEAAGKQRFRLADPSSTLKRPFRLALMSDVQEAVERVGDLYARMNEDPEIEFLIGAGDLTQDGELAQLQRFEEQLSLLNVPYYTTLGNHELGVTPPPYQDLYGRANFSFEYHGARFTLIDSASATIDVRVYEWLDGWLARGRNQFHTVLMHVPPIDPVGVRNGSFASRNEANKLLAKLLDGEVDLTLYGHLHSFFSFENAGIPARVSGGGGAIPEHFDEIGRHFLRLDIDPVQARFETTLIQIEGDFD